MGRAVLWRVAVLTLAFWALAFGARQLGRSGAPSQAVTRVEYAGNTLNVHYPTYTRRLVVRGRVVVYGLNAPQDVLIYTVSHGGGSETYLMDTGQRVRWPVRACADERCTRISWRPDGRALAVTIPSRAADGFPRVTIVDLQAGRAVDIGDVNPGLLSLSETYIWRTR